MDEHPYHIDLQAVADSITEWQFAAQRLPLTDVRDLADAARNGLAVLLDGLNEARRETGGCITPAVAPLVSEVLTQAVMTAIFTLGAVQRTCHAAPAN